MNLMTKDDFPGSGRGRQDGGEGGMGGDGDGVDVPTEREPRTAIFLFFKMSPVIARSGGGEEVGRGKVGGGED